VWAERQERAAEWRQAGLGGVFGRVRACRSDAGAGGVLGAGGEGTGVGVCLMGWSDGGGVGLERKVMGARWW